MGRRNLLVTRNFIKIFEVLYKLHPVQSDLILPLTGIGCWRLGLISWAANLPGLVFDTAERQERICRTWHLIVTMHYGALIILGEVWPTPNMLHEKDFLFNLKPLYHYREVAENFFFWQGCLTFEPQRATSNGARSSGGGTQETKRICSKLHVYLRDEV